MANPLPNEDELFRQIEKECITIHPIIWELLSHHLSNDLYVISIIVQTTVLDKLKPRPMTVEEAEKIHNRVILLKELLSKLRKATRKEGGF